MVNNYYVLAALAREWASMLAGSVFDEAYSYRANEVSLIFGDAQGRRVSIQVSTRPGRTFAFSRPAPDKPRSNVAMLFERARGRTINHVEIAEGDRIVSLVFADGSRFEIHPYGSRANVYLVEYEAGVTSVADAFKRAAEAIGKPSPPPRGIPDSSGLDDPRLTSRLLKEALFSTTDQPDVALERIRSALQSPQSLAYETDDGIIFSPIELRHLGHEPIMTFASVDEGVRWTVLRRSREADFRDAVKHLEGSLERAAVRWERRVSELEAAERTESRADSYEMWGHLLMANPGSASAGDEEVTLPNILTDGSPVTIPLDPQKTVIQNAERYYDRARKSRLQREHLGDRLREAHATSDRVNRLLTELGDAETARDVARFRKQNATELQRFVGGKSRGVDSAPFRRFRITGGFEVWVGRNAQENDVLTFGYASPHDLWLHARGTPGSHVVLRIPGRNQSVGKRARETAAAIAAWFSGARGSGLVPVQITQKKYVTKPKGAPPGVVRVRNEEVLMVEPMLPRPSSTD